MESLGATDPRSVGGYPLFARLGAGGMGQVYLARTPAGRALALKTVRGEFGSDPGFGERFAREIRHADRVRSPWTVAVVDFSPVGTHPQWLATEYVAAPSLADWVTAHGPLPRDSLFALAAELCEALHAVHRAGLAHRDVKPSNVLLPGTRPLLIDFGIARAAEDSRHTRTGGVIGSPGYMAPEQATAGVSAEPGDIFALGAVLVYAATGHGPFNRPGEEPSTPALLYRVVYEEPDLTGLPPDLTDLVRACMDKDPKARPTARGAAELLGAAGSWADRRPPDLAAELMARETAMRTALGEPAAPPATARATVAVTAPASAAHGLAPSPYAPRAPQAARNRGPLPATDPHSGGARWNPAPGAAGYRSGGVARYAPAPAGSRRTPLIAAVVAVAVVLTLIGLWIHQRRSAQSGDTAGAGGTGGTSSSPGTPDADALPASWVGTWEGTGPGNPSASGIGEPRTGTFEVTLTLNPGSRGDLVGKDVSNVAEVGTGRNLGCTEALRLSEVRTGSMVFTAATSHPTDGSYGGVCPTGNVYVVSMTDPYTLALGSEGTQSVGAPSTFTKVG